MKWTELNWNGRWNEQNWSFATTELDRTGPNWTELDWTEVEWSEAMWSEVKWSAQEEEEVPKPFCHPGAPKQFCHPWGGGPELQTPTTTFMPSTLHKKLLSSRNNTKPKRKRFPKEIGGGAACPKTYEIL